MIKPTKKEQELMDLIQLQQMRCDSYQMSSALFDQENEDLRLKLKKSDSHITHTYIAIALLACCLVFLR